jgi:hypothetical protein
VREESSDDDSSGLVPAVMCGGGGGGGGSLDESFVGVSSFGGALGGGGTFVLEVLLENLGGGGGGIVEPRGATPESAHTVARSEATKIRKFIPSVWRHCRLWLLLAEGPCRILIVADCMSFSDIAVTVCEKRILAIEIKAIL